jgi:hypothetical protein
MVMGYVTSKLKKEDIYSDCFHQILQRMDTKFLYKHFGVNFMQSEVWLGDWINKISVGQLRVLRLRGPTKSPTPKHSNAHAFT